MPRRLLPAVASTTAALLVAIGLPPPRRGRGQGPRCHIPRRGDPADRFGGCPGIGGLPGRASCDRAARLHRQVVRRRPHPQPGTTPATGAPRSPQSTDVVCIEDGSCRPHSTGTTFVGELHRQRRPHRRGWAPSPGESSTVYDLHLAGGTLAPVTRPRGHPVGSRLDQRAPLAGTGSDRPRRIGDRHDDRHRHQDPHRHAAQRGHPHLVGGPARDGHRRRPAPRQPRHPRDRGRGELLEQSGRTSPASPTARAPRSSRAVPVPPCSATSGPHSSTTARCRSPAARCGSTCTSTASGVPT